jgi:phage terminase large subunit
MPLDGFDFRHPDYDAVFAARVEWLTRLRAEPALLGPLREYYREHPADFISDWGCTHDTRNVERGLPALIPFVLFQRQREWIDFIVRKWRAQEPGLTEKSRDSGVSWLAVALSCTLCLFYGGLTIGFGSRKEEYVDRIGDPKSLFYKARMFMQELPVEFRGGWDIGKHAPHMRIIFPQTGSIITGEAGDNIGRGNRAAIYFVDEAAFLEHPALIEASLSQTTNCRQDISTPNGPANPFAVKRHSGRIEVFTFHWRHDPRKDEDWYRKQVAELDPVTVAQEIDIDYAASVEGILIPRQWVMSAIDAHEKLNIQVTGRHIGALDVADEGVDKNGFAGCMGILVDRIDEWSGKGGDVFHTVERAFMICDEGEYTGFRFDADGIGAGVRGDARIINERRAREGMRVLRVAAFRGSDSPFAPDAHDVKGRANKDFFANLKAQAWWSLRTRFQRTHRWITEGVACNPDDCISLSSKLPLLMQLVAELAQPTYTINGVGKIVIDKKPEGTKSPNLADAVMMLFARIAEPLSITDTLLHRVDAMGMRRW